ncbi:unnamed protein product [Clonostachys rosea]|uniref:Major facilitator superfamily (MFS) profile domain-containing protein n=2 Tax=Bionectria ochroleuca TaxID=29856 RepID=A0ABY6UBL1_BIOOC|nr:unnamed protein product [Clonostachys rosea]
MCYQVVELYSACKCLYYKHAVDRCVSYGRKGHYTEQRTIYVGYACAVHTSSYSQPSGNYSYSDSGYYSGRSHTSYRVFDMDTGDFDDTPAPSTRPSLAVLRPEEDDTGLSISSSHQGSTSYRHHLLKTATGSSFLADRNLPVPPILSSYSLPKSVHARIDGPKPERENQSFSAEQQIKAPNTSPPMLTTGKHAALQQTSKSERDVSSPPLTEVKQRDLEHSRNRSRNTESSVDNASTRDSVRRSSTLGRDSPVSDQVSIRSGEIHQSRADGSTLVTKVSVSVPRTQGHNPVVKVRPAFDQVSLFPEAYKTLGDVPRPVEKVGPFDSELNKHSETSSTPSSQIRLYPTQSEIPHQQSETVAKLNVEDNPDLGTKTHESLSKVRPFDEIENNVSTEHPLDECEISSGEYQPQTKRVSGQHSIRKCETVPTENEFGGHLIEEHGEEADFVNPTRKYSEAQHEVSQCNVFPTSMEHRQHEWDTCTTVPMEQAAGAHLIQECAPVQDTKSIETDQHDMSDCQGDGHELMNITSGEPLIAKHRSSQDSGNGENGTAQEGSNRPESRNGHHNALQWFKQVFRQRDSNESAPTKSMTMEHDRRRDSEPLRKKSDRNTLLAGSSHQSVRSSTSINKVGFTQAVSDLERLFGEAMAVISQAVEHSEKFCNQTIQIPEQGRLQRVKSLGNDHRGQPLSEMELIEIFPHRAEAAATRDSPTRPSQRSALVVPNRRSSWKKSPLGRQQPANPRQEANIGARTSPCSISGTVCDVIEVVEFGRDDRNTASENTVRRITPPNHHLPGHNQLAGDNTLPERDVAGRQMNHDHGINLRHRSHVSLRGLQPFSLARSHKSQSIARDWSPVRKRFVAAVACISTALVGLIVGIYSGLVPKIQYYIIDESHLTVLGNAGCFMGLALPTFFCWPLPLLHGRKPYILTSLALAMPLLFPQALAVDSQRITNTGSWRALLLASRALMGASLGFASMNFHSILMDLFGASLMSANPHEEVVDRYDARRHGGGMGIWLGIWTWCWIGSLAVGFLIGAAIINEQPPAWGFYVSIILIAMVFILNIICPEVRRSAYRRSMTEVRTEADISRRIARGEVMMHRVRTGPKWCGQEVFHGVLLSLEMLHQPGFAVLALYVAWIYAQIVLIIILLGSLTSKMYRLQSPYVGLLVGSVALGALLAIPFQKASIFSRSRGSRVNSSRATLDRKLSWTSHLGRRAVFTSLLPVAGGCYAVASTGPPLHVSVPTFLAFGVGFLSSLAISECNGIIMEAFDTSDLCPGMTGRQRDPSGNMGKRINYSSFPRVTSGYAIIHTFAFILSAFSTALGGLMTRTLGQRVSSGIVAGILFLLTMSLLLVLIRFKNVQIIPESKTEEMEKIVDARRKSIAKIETITEEGHDIFEADEAWKPTMMGNPVSEFRRMNVLEFGSMSRWQEIRKRNKLIDEDAHLCNRTALGEGLEALDDQMSELRRDAHELLRMASLKSLKGKRSKRFRRSDQGSDNSHHMEMDNLSSGAESIEQTAGSQLHERDPGGRPVLEEDEIEGTNPHQVRQK